MDSSFEGNSSYFNIGNLGDSGFDCNNTCYPPSLLPYSTRLCCCEDLKHC